MKNINKLKILHTFLLIGFAFFIFSSKAFAVTYSPTNTGPTGTIQTYTIPSTGTYTIEAWGAQGGGGISNNVAGGLGAYAKGTVSLTAGDVLQILVGQQGGTGSSVSDPQGNENGGGGGTFVVKQAGSVPQVIAGGGGGGYSTTYGTSCTRTASDGSGSTSTSGTSINCVGVGVGSGGTGGAGGSTIGSYQGGAGGGFSTNGANGGTHCATAIGGLSFTNGGTGGAGNSCYSSANAGGFGGGGGGQLGGPGAGGGYSGGGSSGSWSSYSTYGGGGGSYIIAGATGTVLTAGSRSGAGQVIITAGGGGGSGSSQFRAVSGTSGGSGCTGPYVTTVPAGTQNNDVMIAQIYVGGGSATTITPPAGWTLVSTTSDAISLMKTAIYYRVASSEPASYSWTTSNYCGTAIIASYSGISTSSPIDVQSGVVDTVVQATHNAPTVTTTAANETVVTFFAGYTSSCANVATWTPPGAQAERKDQNNASCRNSEQNDSTQVSAGSTGTLTATSSFTTNSISNIIVLRNANTAPSITVNPSTTYSGYTRTSASVNWTMNFTATDAEQTGANALTYYVHTGASRTGTQVATGTFTSGSSAPSFSYASSGLGDGTNTLYLSIYDGTAYSATNPSFTVLRDSGVPNAATSISTNPSTVTSSNQYTTTFTSTDTYSTSTNELAFNIRTAAGGGGTLLASGNATSSTPVSTGTITDAALAAGANTRYVRVCDGGSNCTDTSFTVTKVAAPTVTTQTQTSITSSGATLGGNVTSDGGSAVTGRGVCIGASANPVLGGTCFSTAGTTGIFTVSATPLSPATTYHFRAYATNAINTGYTPDDTFITSALVPAITNPTQTATASGSITLGGNITSDGGSAVTGRGVCIGASANPVLGGTCFSTAGTTGIFTVSATPLSAGTLYHYRAYATNAIGTTYTGDDTFTTYIIAAPSITILPETNYDNITTTINATVNPNSVQTTAFFVWGTTNTGSCSSLPNFTPVQSGLTGGVAQPLTANLSGLLKDTTYYYCAVSYSSTANGGGLTYGNGGVPSSFVQGGTASVCTGVPLTGDYKLTSDCTFGNSAVDGVDSGSGTTNLALLDFTGGATITIGSGQLIAYGDLNLRGLKMTRAATGGLRRGAIWIPDTDGDTWPDSFGSSNEILSNTQPSGYMRRSDASAKTVDCAPTDPTKWLSYPGGLYQDGDGDTYTALSTKQPVCTNGTVPSGYSSTTLGSDCDDTNAYIFTNVTGVYTDADNDGYYTGSVNAGNTCAGAQSTINTRTYYKGPTGAPGAAGASPYITTGTLGANDCAPSFSGLNTTCAPTITASGTIGSVTVSTAVFNSAGATAGTYTANGFFRYDTSNVACGSLTNVTTNNSLTSSATSNPATTFSGSAASLVGNTRYYWCAAATNNWNTSTTTNDASTQNFLTPPGAPTSVVAGSVTLTTLTITFTPPAGGAASYNLKWCAGTGCTPGVSAGSGTTTPAPGFGTISGISSGYVHNAPLTCGTIYKYIVTAVNATASVNSAASAETSTTACCSSTTYYQDADSDTKGNPNVSQAACSQPAGYVANNTDCNDSNGSIYQNVANLYTDADYDGYYTGSINSGNTCVGTTASTCNGTATGRTYYIGSNGQCTYLASGFSGGSDCYDTYIGAQPNSASNTHPSQGSYFTSANGLGSWDYNCSTATDYQYGSDKVASWFCGTAYYDQAPYTCNATVSQCSSNLTASFTQAACGETYTHCTTASSYWTAAGCATRLYSCSGSVTQACH